MLSDLFQRSRLRLGRDPVNRLLNSLATIKRQRASEAAGSSAACSVTRRSTLRVKVFRIDGRPDVTLDQHRVDAELTIGSALHFLLQNLISIMCSVGKHRSDDGEAAATIEAAPRPRIDEHDEWPRCPRRPSSRPPVGAMALNARASLDNESTSSTTSRPCSTSRFARSNTMSAT